MGCCQSTSRSTGSPRRHFDADESQDRQRRHDRSSAASPNLHHTLAALTTLQADVSSLNEQLHNDLPLIGERLNPIYQNSLRLHNDITTACHQDAPQPRDFQERLDAIRNDYFALVSTEFHTTQDFHYSGELADSPASR